MEPCLTPSRPCYYCGSTQFGLVDDLWMDAGCKNKIKGEGLMLHFAAIICTGCSATQFFMKQTDDHLLTSCRHEIVNVASRSPYRSFAIRMEDQSQRQTLCIQVGREENQVTASRPEIPS